LGLLVFLLSKPDGWSINLKRIAKERADGIGSITSAMNELLTLGYAKRELIRDAQGVLGGSETTIFEELESIEVVKHTEGMETPRSENPTSVNSTPDKGTDSLKTEVVKHLSVNPLKAKHLKPSQGVQATPCETAPPHTAAPPQIPTKLQLIHGFTEVWAEWVEFRRGELKKPLKPSSIKTQLKMLLDDPDPVGCIERSISAGYQGLFPSVKKNAPTQTTTTRSELKPMIGGNE
jgi:hypothetical protein